MTTAMIIEQIFQLVLLPLLAALTTYLIAFIQKQGDKLKEETKNETTQKYVKMLTDTISACVAATNQTYVESLKQQGKFTKEAQKIAFQATYDTVLKILSDEAKVYLNEFYGDLNTYLTQQIEAEINKLKGE